MDHTSHFSDAENPYRSPESDNTTRTPPERDTIRTPPGQEAYVYRLSEASVRIVTILLAVNLILLLAAALSHWSELRLLKAIAAGSAPTNEAIESNDQRQAAMGIAQLLVLVVTVIVFCMWLHRANANARALGAEGMRFTPGWSFGFFFIPVFNLFRPFQAVKEIGQASHPEAGESRELWRQSGTLPALRIWWTFWLLYNFSAQLSTRTAARGVSLNELISSATISTCSDMFGAVAAFFAMVVVRSIQARQVGKYQALFGGMPHVMASLS